MYMPKENLTWLISDPDAEAGAIETTPATHGMSLLTKQELAQINPRFGTNDKVCITSEAVMDAVLQRLDDEDRRNAITIFKDKHAFRELLRGMYPELHFEQIASRDLYTLNLDPQRKYVIKPVKGCFGSGVRLIDGDADLIALGEDIYSELQRNAAIFSDSVLSIDQLIVEDYIEGEEYAVDMFYDSEGQPVITNIYHHPIPNNPAYLHMLYYSSQAVFERLFDPAMRFFEALNQQLNVRRLPIHCEFRMMQERLIPIEFNSLRFGGMGLANLSYYAVGVNAYDCFVTETRPDWREIWQGRPDTAFGFFIAYNGTQVDTAVQQPDWARFRTLFSKILLEVPFDYQNQLAFGILYIEEPVDRIGTFLNTEFNEYFVPN